MKDFAVIEAKFRNLLDKLRSGFSALETGEVTTFLEAGEYGIALETLCSIIIEEKKSVTEEVYTLIDELGRQMEMDSSTWSRIRPPSS